MVYMYLTACRRRIRISRTALTVWFQVRLDYRRPCLSLPQTPIPPKRERRGGERKSSKIKVSLNEGKKVRKVNTQDFHRPGTEWKEYEGQKRQTITFVYIGHFPGSQ